MNKYNKNTTKKQIVLSFSTLLIMLSIIFFLINNMEPLTYNEFPFTYETIDIKKMSTANISIKKTSNNRIFKTTVSAFKPESKPTEVILENKKANTDSEKGDVPTTKISPWRLPTEQGYITQYSHYNHIALDITSPKGTNERIYPVADGTISSIYQDQYGAKIITIRHYINDTFYTSQYVHLSWYAYGLYVGQQVTTDTVLGGMGETGLATGVHLHLSVIDCNLYVDQHCSNLDKFYDYGKMRVIQGFTGLDTLINVPDSWYYR